MLELIDIKKRYIVGGVETRALNGINVAFREREFVAILGASGSGKTTCLNIVGGLDRYDSGEMTIKGKKTKDFSDKDWDAYRNNSIGFVFQSYNLITHLSIVANVEMSLTLSGVSASEKRRRALEVLKRVGLEEHLHKKPNQLSGGQMQRVAIARALVNNPEILLCDEPTGALDSVTSVQILDLIKEIANDRLVIMVTHNPSLAEKYADRIIKFEDGLIISDTNPHQERPKEDMFNLKKTSMSFFTALNLSFNNLKTKKGRTFLTSFASSIGIIGIAVILSLSTGLQMQIDRFQSDAMAEFPIIITPAAMNMDQDDIRVMRNEIPRISYEEYPDTQEIYPFDPSARSIVHTNIFTEEYINYINNIDPDICSSIGYTRIASMNLFREIDGEVIPVSITSGVAGMTGGSGMGNPMMSMQNAGLSAYPIQLNKERISYLETNYELVAGEFPSSVYDLILVTDTRNRINVSTLQNLGFALDFDFEAAREANAEKTIIKVEDIIGTEFKLIDNNDYYVKTEFETYLPDDNYEKMYNSDASITLRIVGIVRQSPESNIGLLSPGLAYSDELSQVVIDNAMNSDIVTAQKEVEYNIMTRSDFNEGEKEMFLSLLGGNAMPSAVMLYPNTFDGKEAVLEYLDKYNESKERADRLYYTDLAGSISNLTGSIMNGVTLVLIGFAAISLFVSLIMISIIIYTSVLERTKEIGILKALGARKKDISRVFDAETCILGIFSGVLGVSIAYLCTIPINSIVYNMTELNNVSHLRFIHAVLLVILSTALTMLGGHIPARIASKKDAVEALRSE